MATETVSYPLATPQAGWAEQNPQDWWQATQNVIKIILKESGIEAAAIKGISFSGQMHSSVFLDKNREVIRPAILWSDTRTSKQCQQIIQQAGGLPSLIEYVSNPALEGFTAPKILWLKQKRTAKLSKSVNGVIAQRLYSLSVDRRNTHGCIRCGWYIITGCGKKKSGHRRY